MRAFRTLRMFFSIVWREGPCGSRIAIGTAWKVARILHWE